jgi:hypothetical protein
MIEEVLQSSVMNCWLTTTWCTGEPRYNTSSAARIALAIPYLLTAVALSCHCCSFRVLQVDCEPDYEHCSGVVCGLDEFCADGRTCRPNNCKERQRYMCPADTSPLRSVACINSTFTDCYLSQHFNCSIGPGTAQTSCTLKPEANSAGKPAAWRLSSQVRLQFGFRVRSFSDVL